MIRETSHKFALSCTWLIAAKSIAECPAERSRLEQSNCVSEKDISFLISGKRIKISRGRENTKYT
jgi:hypothetical protein